MALVTFIAHINLTVVTAVHQSEWFMPNAGIFLPGCGISQVWLGIFICRNLTSAGTTPLQTHFLLIVMRASAISEHNNFCCLLVVCSVSILLAQY